MENSINTVCDVSNLVMVCKFHKSGVKILHYFLDVAIPTNTLYIGKYSVLTYIEKLFSTVYYLLSYFCWLVNCMSRFSKFLNFF